MLKHAFVVESGWESRSASASAWKISRADVRQGWDSVSPDIDADAYYRSHWNARYGNRADSGAYDEHAPAYLFGDEARHAGELSPWENFMDAVKHGWNRIHVDTDDRTSWGNPLDWRLEQIQPLQ